LLSTRIYRRRFLDPSSLGNVRFSLPQQHLASGSQKRDWGTMHITSTCVLLFAVALSALSVKAQTTEPLTASPGVLAQAIEKPKRARVAPAPSSAVSGEQSVVSRVNNWTVGIAGGLLEGTFIRFAAELAKALDDGENMRILPVVTFGAAENVNDLLYLKGIDVSITHADVFDEFRKNGKAANVERRVNYISQMYVGELHVFARPEIKTLKDLEGKRVGFNTKGAGPTITGPILFERLGIKVEPVYINNSIAIEKMKTGEIAAILHTVGKPNDLFTKLKPEPGFHFLQVDYTDKFSDYYVPSTLGHEDYPNLFKAGEKIETLGIPVVLAVYNWPREHDRFRRVERFIQYYFSRFETLKQPPFHAKWRDINLAAKVPGWSRYWVADEMLAKVTSGLPPTPASGAAPVDINIARAQAAQVAPGNKEEQEKLFQRFLEWTKSQQKQ
jgi:TRAP-type uncharacterized transport system substrate-binding protein